MRVLIDACVLFSTVPRALVLGCAGADLIVPLWSARILEEWRRAVLRAYPDQHDQARAEIALAKAGFPQAEMPVPGEIEDDLSLPDANDRHVLAAAIAGRAEVLLTRNLRDFPARTLARHGVAARSPDSLLLELWGARPETFGTLAEPVLAGVTAASGLSRRAVLKRSGLPRLARAMAP